MVASWFWWLVVLFHIDFSTDLLDCLQYSGCLLSEQESMKGGREVREVEREKVRERERERGREPGNLFYDPARAVTHHLFHHILFIRRESKSSPH